MSENVHPRADELDSMSVDDFLQVMHEEDLNAVRAIAPALEQMARTVDQVAGRLRAGGRLHYFGAGTSGMIAALDAVECPATWRPSPSKRTTASWASSPPVRHECATTTSPSA